MIERRPESASAASIRRLVSDASSRHEPSCEPPVAAARPADRADWPDADLDMLPRRRSTSAVPFEPKPDRRYAISDFTRFHDRDFVAAVYVGLLERQADPAGFAHYVQMLRRGHSKTEIIGRLRYSSEGKRVDATVPHLRLRYPLAVASRLPLIGSLLSLVEVIVRANAMKASIRRLEAHMSALAAQQEDELDAVDASARRNAAVLEARIEALRDR